MSFTIAVTTAETDRIASIAEPVLRNLSITQCYYELSAIFARRMGTVANWCTFATWASKQAGQTIRRQDLQRSLEAMLRQEPEIEAALSLVVTLAKQAGAKESFDQLRESALAEMLKAAAIHASDAVSRGNKKVFEEIGREFSRFMAACFDDAVYDQSHIDAFGQPLLPGAPPFGQDYLREAFIGYYKALFEEDPKKKTELNLLANLQIGFHEQNRLQPEIAEALNASLPDVQQLKIQLRDKLLSGTSFRSKFMLLVKQVAGKTGLLDKAIEALVQRIQFHLRRALTTHLMTLTIPGNRLHLGRDLSMPYHDDVKQLVNADLLALLRQTDPTPDSLLESGATDWANLAERMHFISELFRCCHSSKELFDAAFTPGQVKALKEGRLPGGIL